MITRDYEYENNNKIYDEINCKEAIRCKNYELCEEPTSIDLFLIYGSYICINCRVFGWNNLIFINNSSECCICLNSCTKKLLFPTNCGHSFCLECSRSILYWDETRYHLSPIPYGCPPCPNSCINPIKGKQCYCDEYDIIQNNWKLSNPEEYQLWNNDELLSIEKGEPLDSAYGNRICPLCRRKYENK